MKNRSMDEQLVFNLIFTTDILRVVSEEPFILPAPP